MILKRLVEYADNHMDLPPPMYGETRVRWFVDVTPDGALEGFTPRDGEDGRGENLLAPQIVRAAGIKPKLLADNGEYVLSIARPTSKPRRVEECHRQFVELTQRCAEETEEPSVAAVARFLETWESDTGLLPEGFDPADTLTFRVGDTVPASELRSVRDFWAAYTAGGDKPVMTCLVTGEVGAVEDRLPVKIKRVPGGQTSGTSLVSANVPAFESYGLENSLTSPISRDAGERFGKALNELLANRNTSVRIGPVAYAFWAREAGSMDLLNLLSTPDPQSVRNLFDSAYSGRERRGVAPDDFYALALSASGGRAVVRDWLETTVPEAEQSLRRWFERQRIVGRNGEEAEPVGVWRLAASAYRDASDEMRPAVPTALVRAAIRDGPLPEELLARAVRRNRADGDVTHPRAALMKLILLSKGGDEMTEITETLEPEHPDTAYHCGRLLAELEALQKTAIRGINATLVDRYYGSASSAPASVFGSLINGSRAHLSKLRKESRGADAAIERRIEEITTSIGAEFPRTLTLRQQAVFALGYYHQRAHQRAQRAAAREAKEQS